MLSINDIVIFILLLLNIVCFSIGYLLGKSGTNSTEHKNIKSFFDQEKNSKPKIEIDTSKVVTKINTDGMEKKYNSLGETKITTDNVQSSVNKLKNLKQ